MKSFFLYVAVTCFSLATAAQATTKLQECVIENGVLKIVEIGYNSTTREKTIILNGVKTDFNAFQAKSKEYAGSTAWFINSEEIEANNRKYRKYGLPRVLGMNDIAKTGDYKTIGVYSETGKTGVQEIVYIPVRPGCEFQPYLIIYPPCGTLTFKANPAIAKPGEDVTLTAVVANAKQQLNYSWSITKGYPKSSEYSESVIVTAPDTNIEATVYISAKGCESKGTTVVKVVK